MEFEIKEPIRMEEGAYSGVIIRIAYRTEPFEYIDIFIKPIGKDFELKYGCPSHVSLQSKLGKLLQIFGGKLELGKKIDPEKILVGKKCKFLVQNEETEKGTFFRIAEGSLKLDASATVIQKGL